MLSEVPSTPTPPKLSQRSSSAYKNSGLKRVMAVKPERNRLLDETGWRQNGEKRWIWAFVAPVFTFYIVATSRGVAVLESLPGAAFEGILCSDWLPSYLSYHQGRAQLCWARLKLNLMEIELGDDWSATFRSRRVASIRQVVPPLVEFSGWPADRTQLLRRSLPIQREFLKLAE